jgi:hypothetical protein
MSSKFNTFRESNQRLVTENRRLKEQNKHLSSAIQSHKSRKLQEEFLNGFFQKNRSLNNVISSFEDECLSMIEMRALENNVNGVTCSGLLKNLSLEQLLRLKHDDECEKQAKQESHSNCYICKKVGFPSMFAHIESHFRILNQFKKVYKNDFYKVLNLKICNV